LLLEQPCAQHIRVEPPGVRYPPARRAGEPHNGGLKSVGSILYGLTCWPVPGRGPARQPRVAPGVAAACAWLLTSARGCPAIWWNTPATSSSWALATPGLGDLTPTESRTRSIALLDGKREDTVGFAGRHQVSCYESAHKIDAKCL